jgi:hypothetical protein
MLEQMRVALSKSMDEEEGDEILVLHARRGAWQVAPSTARAPETLVHGWGLCGNQTVSWVIPTKLQNSLSRPNRRRFG